MNTLVKKALCFSVCLTVLTFSGCAPTYAKEPGDTTVFIDSCETDTDKIETTDSEPPETQAPEETTGNPVTTEVSETTAPEKIPVNTVEVEVVLGDPWFKPSPETAAPPVQDLPPSNQAPSGEPLPAGEYPPAGLQAPSALMYHLILEEPTTSLTGLFVRPSDFEDQLKTLNAGGYYYMFADEYSYTRGKSVILTFDDGYIDNYTEMFPLLKKYNARATIFLITGYIDRKGYLTTEQIKEMSESGLVHFGSHTVTHQALTSLSESSLRNEFAASKEAISKLTGKQVTAVCYPGGSVNTFVAKIASEYYSYGYTTVSDKSTAGYNHMLLPRLRVSRGMSGVGLSWQLG